MGFKDYPKVLYTLLIVCISGVLSGLCADASNPAVRYSREYHISLLADLGKAMADRQEGRIGLARYQQIFTNYCNQLEKRLAVVGHIKNAENMPPDSKAERVHAAFERLLLEYYRALLEYHDACFYHHAYWQHGTYLKMEEARSAVVASVEDIQEFYKVHALPPIDRLRDQDDLLQEVAETDKVVADSNAQYYQMLPWRARCFFFFKRYFRDIHQENL